MVVTLVTDTFDVNNNGITVSCKRLAQGLLARGHRVRVLTQGNPQKSGPDAATGLEMHYVPALWLPLATPLARKQNTSFGKPVRQTLLRAVAGADVVHVFQPWPLDAAAARLARKMGVPVLAGFHIQPENITYNLGLGWCPPAAHLAYWLMRVLFYRHFTHIHCPSKFIAAQLRGHGYKAWLHVVSNGIDPDFCPDQTVEKFDDGLFHVVMVGRLSPEKRQDVLLRAVQKSRYAHRIQLHFAGYGPRQNKLWRMGQKLPRMPEFGYYNKSDLIHLLRRCHLYVHASDIEIEGMGCTEAFACGLVPVISDSRHSATAQFALSEENLFRAGDAAALARRIDHWIEHHYDLPEAGALYARYAEAYALEKSLRQMESSYRAIAGQEPCLYHRSGPFQLLSRVCTTFIGTPLLFAYTRLVLGMRMSGLRNLRGVKGALTVCNHVHTLDSVLVGTALFPRKIVFPTLASNLGGLFPGKLVNLFGGVPVPEKIGDMDTFFNEMEFQLMKGRMVHFFPEGHLVPYDDDLRAFRKGAFRLAARARVPIVPMTISYEAPRGIYRMFRKKPLLRLNIGQPVYPVSADHRHDERARMELVRGQMERALTDRPGA